MADHSLPTLTTAYTSFLPNLSDRIKDVMLANDPASTTVTNPPTGTVRWNSATNIFEKWNGSAWALLSSGYAINILGNAATATVASAVAWSGVSGKPTTLAGFGITDGAPLANAALTGTPTVNGFPIGYKNIPPVPISGGNASSADVGKCYAATAGFTIPASVFAAGDAFGIWNDSAAAITITQGAGLTMYNASTNGTGNRTLAAHAWASVWFRSATVAGIIGAGLT